MCHNARAHEKNLGPDLSTDIQKTLHQLRVWAGRTKVKQSNWWLNTDRQYQDTEAKLRFAYTSLPQKFQHLFDNHWKM